MKNLPRVLVFSAVLALTACCHRKASEAPGPGDAAAAPEATDASGAAPSEGTQTGTSRGAVLAPEDSGSATQAGDAGTGDAGTRAMAPSGGASREAQEACLDKWLAANKLDKYGHPEGTMYAGGTPLFDERTGESRDRLDYVYSRKPEARKACGGGAASK